MPAPSSPGLLKRPELRGLLALFLVSGPAAAFLLLASLVVTGRAHDFDERILLLFRVPGDPADPVGPFWMESAVRDVTALGGYLILVAITLIVAGYLLMRGKRLSAVLVLAAVFGGMIWSNLLKLLFDRPRPDVVAHLTDVHSLSFPSGHAMLSAATYLTLGALLARTERSPAVRAYVVSVAVATAVLIGLSRLYLGVHYPTDVLAGWCAGAAWATVCWLAARRLQQRGDVEPSG